MVFSLPENDSCVVSFSNISTQSHNQCAFEPDSYSVSLKHVMIQRYGNTPVCNFQIILDYLVGCDWLDSGFQCWSWGPPLCLLCMSLLSDTLSSVQG